jgi:hypothetical protein
MYTRQIRGFTSSHSFLEIERFLLALERGTLAGEIGWTDGNGCNFPDNDPVSSNEKALGKAAAAVAATGNVGLSETLMMAVFGKLSNSWAISNS